MVIFYLLVVEIIRYVVSSVRHISSSVCGNILAVGGGDNKVWSVRHISRLVPGDILAFNGGVITYVV